MSLNLFIIGPSGSGKSTQAKLIAKKYQLTHFSVGQIIRDQISLETKLGQEAKSFLDSGNLVPDKVIHPLLTQSLEKINYQNYIIDGFPRLLDQGLFIEEFLLKINNPFDLIIHLDVTSQEITLRRSKMGDSFQDASRTDTSPEDIASRQAFYDKNNQPIIDHFSSLGKLLRIDGNRPVAPIFEDIKTNLDKLLNHKNSLQN